MTFHCARRCSGCGKVGRKTSRFLSVRARKTVIFPTDPVHHFFDQTAFVLKSIRRHCNIINIECSVVQRKSTSKSTISVCAGLNFIVGTRITSKLKTLGSCFARSVLLFSNFFFVLPPDEELVELKKKNLTVPVRRFFSPSYIGILQNNCALPYVITLSSRHWCTCTLNISRSIKNRTETFNGTAGQ